MQVFPQAAQVGHVSRIIRYLLLGTSKKRRDNYLRVYEYEVMRVRHEAKLPTLGLYDQNHTELSVCVCAG